MLQVKKNNKYVCCIILLTKLYVYTHVWRGFPGNKHALLNCKHLTYTVAEVSLLFFTFLATDFLFILPNQQFLLCLFSFSGRIIELLNPIKISIRKWVYRKHIILSNYV